jgi:Uma2 family endonuclease
MVAVDRRSEQPVAHADPWPICQLHPGLARVAPLLAVEVTGAEEDEELMREKAAWYLRAGAQIVWIALPELHQVVVLTNAGTERYPLGDTLPEHAALPGLTPHVDDLFQQITR